jgi:hypothetical protein
MARLGLAKRRTPILMPRRVWWKILGVRCELVGTIDEIETIATGPSLKLRSFLRKTYGRGRWRKLKGIATVRLRNGKLRRVELHWYEAHGIGKRDMKIKSYVDTP